MQRFVASLAALAVVAAIADVSSAAKITCKAGGTYVLPAPGGGFIVNGTTKSDQIKCGPEKDTIHGNGGNDHISGGGGGDTITLGNQTSTGALGFDSDSTCDSKGGTITAGNGNNSLVGCNGSDTFTAGNGNNQVSAKGGDDKITLGTGSNRVHGGPGNDTVTVSKSKKVNKIDCGTGTGDVATVDSNDKVKNCETVNRNAT